MFLTEPHWNSKWTTFYVNIVCPKNCARVAPCSERRWTVLGLSDTIVLTVELNAPDSSIRMSQEHYEQILVNLVVNAQDAMPKGGKMTLRTECKWFDSSPRHVIGQRHTRGPHVVTTLTDTGCGMNSDTLHNAFDPFFTTKSKGTGLSDCLRPCHPGGRICYTRVRAGSGDLCGHLLAFRGSGTNGHTSASKR